MANWHSKFRPKSFKTFLGNETVIKVIKKDLTSDDPTQTWLITGSAGSGKSTTAFLIGRILLQCDLKEDVRLHPDFTELNANKEGSKDKIIATIENTRFKPKKSDYKVIFIDEVHLLLKPAASALLDILEEPPQHVVIILATNEPAKVLQTIRQRAKTVQLSSLTQEQLEQLLTRIAQREDMSYVTDKIVTYIAGRFVGRTREAITALKDLKTIGDKGRVDVKALEIELKRAVIDDYTVAATILKNLYTGQYAESCKAIDEISDMYHVVSSLLDLNNYILQRLAASNFYLNAVRKDLWLAIKSTKPHIAVVLVVQHSLFELKRTLTTDPMLDPKQVMLYHVASCSVGMIQRIRDGKH